MVYSINWTYVVQLPVRVQVHYRGRLLRRQVMSPVAIHRWPFQTGAWSNDRSRVWLKDSRGRKKLIRQVVNLGHGWPGILQKYHTILLQRRHLRSARLWYYEKGHVPELGALARRNAWARVQPHDDCARRKQERLGIWEGSQLRGGYGVCQAQQVDFLRDFGQKCRKCWWDIYACNQDDLLECRERRCLRLGKRINRHQTWQCQCK